ncbi:hypothetical protein Dsin_006543 [Dipteronia sinensis]|uniref:BHLH domain-containing protein n=1 Tax=Dipteronia sinensis TaxID=43782 RepID=A0AAE0ANV0_9ROSI|nr:hypothetical protein Dsin_014812 [Dipteronia sinensis]KAK3226681.1 hypothetical protein Dsin_006543 [Dipteronia sinensis]
MSSSGSKITEDEINHLISKLQELLPQLNRTRNGKVSASKVLKETCSYIKTLQSEVDGLSERLSQLLNSMDITSVDDILQL